MRKRVRGIVRLKRLTIGILALGLLGGAGGYAAQRLPQTKPANSREAQTHTYTNPVLNHEFADPSVLNDSGIYYGYATNSAGGNLPCARSTDLAHWSELSDAMPTLPPWARPGLTWAPNIAMVVPGKRYVAYITARNRASEQQAIGTAVASSPTGPFLSSDTKPLIEQRELGGCIDASSFVDSDHSRYLVWKNDGNSRRQDTWLWIQRLTPDGLHLLGSPTRLVRQDQPWESYLVEAPTLVKHGKKYYLFYSANNYTNCDYAIGYAVADNVLGPYTKPRDTPLVASVGGKVNGVCGPGGQDVFVAQGGGTWMAYHSWQNGANGRRYRSMSLDPLVWAGDVPYLLGPSRLPQPLPIAPSRNRAKPQTQIPKKRVY